MTRTSRAGRWLICEVVTLLALPALASPVHVDGPGAPDLDQHDGGLPPAIGVHNIQVMRANRSQPTRSNGTGWTYNHAPVLAHWRGRFYLQFLSAPVHEEQAPMHAQLTTSVDGRTWSTPQVVFSAYRLPDGRMATFHYRMGFFVTADGRLLAMTFVGGLGKKDRPGANDGLGIGRLVREVRPDGAFGPVYFLRLNTHRGWHAANVSYPLYTSSPDDGFRRACDEVLAHRLHREQWWEEDRSNDGFYAVSYPKTGLKAMSFWHAADGAVIAAWKGGHFAESRDQGLTWSNPVQAPTVVTNGAKVWGQRTSAGYVMLYNPTPDNLHRWPLAMVSGADGRRFGDMTAVHGEVPPQRYAGLNRESGPQYVRGIAEGTGTPPGPHVWVSYSVNKEDLWVARIPAAPRSRETAPVRERFTRAAPGELPEGWNVYAPLWAPVRVAAFPGPRDRSLLLSDGDPHDYARAVRVFPAAVRLTLALRVWAAGDEPLEIELLSREGRAPVRLRVRTGQPLQAADAEGERVLSSVPAGRWVRLAVHLDSARGRYDLEVDGRPVARALRTATEVRDVERVSFRTGPRRTLPTRQSPPYKTDDLPGADEALPPSTYHLDDVEITTRD